MTWPTAPTFATTHLDAGADDPAQARVDIKAMADDLSNVIGGRGQADGVASLVGSTVPTAQLPTVPIANGGTGATTAAAARTALGVDAALGYTAANKAGSQTDPTFLGRVIVEVTQENDSSSGIMVKNKGVTAEAPGKIILYNESTSPAIGDLIASVVDMARTAPASGGVVYSRIDTLIDAIGASFRGKLSFKIAHNGTLTEICTLHSDGTDAFLEMTAGAILKAENAVVSGTLGVTGDATFQNVAASSVSATGATIGTGTISNLTADAKFVGHVVSVADADDPTELNSIAGTVGQYLMVRQINAAGDHITLYTFDNADSGGADAPFKMAASGGGFWVAIAGYLVANVAGSPVKRQGISTGTLATTGVVTMSNLPTADPGEAGQLWSDSGTIKISAG